MIITIRSPIISSNFGVTIPVIRHFAQKIPLLGMGRYHSLSVAEASLPPELKVIAKTDDDVVMAIQHATFPPVGMQFHPESILTEQGMQLLENFLSLV